MAFFSGVGAFPGGRALQWSYKPMLPSLKALNGRLSKPGHLGWPLRHGQPSASLSLCPRMLLCTATHNSVQRNEQCYSESFVLRNVKVFRYPTADGTNRTRTNLGCFYQRRLFQSLRTVETVDFHLIKSQSRALHTLGPLHLWSWMGHQISWQKSFQMSIGYPSKI